MVLILPSMSHITEGIFMFRYQVNAFHQAEARCYVQRDRDGYYVVANERRITASTPDDKQVEHWLRVVTVHYALHLLNITPGETAGLAATTAYAAFARELEK